MTLSTSILMIVAAVSAATSRTGGTETVISDCCGSDRSELESSQSQATVPVSYQRVTWSQPRTSTAFPWEPEAAERRWIYVVIHHSGTSSGSVAGIHAEHKRRKDQFGQPWLGIGYHFVIGNGNGMKDGQVESTFRWKEQIHGAHSGSRVHNDNGIGVCLIGNFEQQKPTPRQLTAVVELVRQLAERYQIPARLVIGHNTVKPTACPGKMFPLQDVRRKSYAKLSVGSRELPRVSAW